MDLAEQIPFSLFSGPLGEDVVGPDRSYIRAVLQFQDAISSMGQQYQYLVLEVASTEHTRGWRQGDPIWHGWNPGDQRVGEPTRRWRITQQLESTYPNSLKFTCTSDDNGKLDVHYITESRS